LRRSNHAGAIRGSLLILLGTVLGLVSFGTWGVRTYDFGWQQAVIGMDVGGPLLVALSVILVGAGLGYLFGVGVAQTVSLIDGTVAFIYTTVRAAQLGAEDFPLGYVTEVEWALWVGIAASALTITVGVTTDRRSPMTADSAEA